MAAVSQKVYSCRQWDKGECQDHWPHGLKCHDKVLGYPNKSKNFLDDKELLYKMIILSILGIK